VDLVELVNELKRVRERGLPRTIRGALKNEPALHEALTLCWPSVADASRARYLKELLGRAVELLEPHTAEGIRLALDLRGEGGTSADRRARFASHYDLAAVTVRKNGIEDQALNDLALAILSLPQIASRLGTSDRPSDSGQSGGSAVAQAVGEVVMRGASRTLAPREPIRVLRALERAAEKQGRWDEAASWSAALLGLLQDRAKSSPGDHESQLAEEYLQAGLFSMMAGRPENAEDHLLSARRISQTLVDLEPASREYQGLSAWVEVTLGLTYPQAGRLQDAEDVLSRAVPLLGQLVDRDGDDEASLGFLAAGLAMLGALYLQQDRDDDAEDALVRAIGHFRQLADENPDDADYVGLVATPLTTLGLLYAHADREREAEDALIRAVDLLQPRTAGAADNHENRIPLMSARILLAQAHYGLGIVYVSTDRLQDAEAALVRATALMQGGFDEELPGPMNGLLGAMPMLLATALVVLGLVYQAMERFDDSESAFSSAASHLQQMADDDPANSGILEMHADVLESLVEVYQEVGRPADADEVRLRAHTIRTRLANQEPDDPHSSSE